MPASTWEESLISGNGTMGMLIPGAANKDRIVLSHERLFLPKAAPVDPPDLGSQLEETRTALLEGDYEKAAEILEEESANAGIYDLLWTNPHIPACQIEFESLDPIEPTFYARSVNYETGEARVAYKNGDVLIHQDAFVSRADNISVIRLRSPNGSKLSYKLRLNQLPLTADDHEEIDDDTDFEPEDYVSKTDISAGENYLSFTTLFKKQWEGSLKSVTVAVKLSNSGGIVTADSQHVSIENADEILMLATIKLSYDSVPYPYRDLLQDIEHLGKDYDAVLDRHVLIHSEIFNMDISGGLPAVVTYMLVQSTGDHIELLPALPEEWPDGKINEVLCRGGFEIDMAWENSKPTSVSIESLCGNNTTLVFKGSSRELNLEKGERIELNF
jgi:hypothetical protein